MRTSSGKKLLCKIVISILCLTMLWGICVRKLENSFYVIAENEVRQITNSTINESFSSISEKINYEDIIDISKGANDEIIALSANGINISKYKNLLTESFQEKIYKQFPYDISIPIGKLLPYPILHSAGPDIKFKIHPASFVKTELTDKFESSGINQVRHAVYLNIYVNFTISGNIYKKTYELKDVMLLADTILLGEVPKYYGGTGIISENG